MNDIKYNIMNWSKDFRETLENYVSELRKRLDLKTT